MAKKGKARLTVIVMIFSMLCSSVVPVQAKKEIRVKKISVIAPKKQPLKLTVGQKYKLKVKITPHKATNKKLKYTTSSKKTVTVNKNGLLQAKKAGTAKITIKTRDKSNKKATVNVKISKKKTNTVSVPTKAPTPAPASTPTQTILPVSTPTQSSSVSPEATPTPIPDGDFVLASTSGVSQVYLNPDADEYKGLNMVADCFSEDVRMVCGTQADIVTDAKKLKGNVIIFGSIGNNPMIDRLISAGKINVDNVKNKWEVYQYDVIENPVEGVEKALVITGSDKRGAIYGLFNLSEMMGVSPWVYWADVTPEHKDTISFKYVSSFDENTYVEAHGYVAMEAGNYSDKSSDEKDASWEEIEGYGRTKSGMKVFPTTETFYDTSDAPYVEYKFYVDSTDKYTMQTHIAPSNNVDWNNVTMKFAYSIDGGDAKEVDTIPPSYIAGTWRDSTWSNAVKNNIRSIDRSIGTLEKGVHTLRIYGMDPAIVLEKFIIYPKAESLKASYLGPQESYIKRG